MRTQFLALLTATVFAGFAGAVGTATKIKIDNPVDTHSKSVDEWFEVYKPQRLPPRGEKLKAGVVYIARGGDKYGDGFIGDGRKEGDCATNQMYEVMDANDKYIVRVGNINASHVELPAEYRDLPVVWLPHGGHTKGHGTWLHTKNPKNQPHHFDTDRYPDTYLNIADPLVEGMPVYTFLYRESDMPESEPARNRHVIPNCYTVDPATGLPRCENGRCKVK